MINYRPILALSIVATGFLISISVIFLDALGPKIPLPRKSIMSILNTSNNNSSLLLTKKNIKANDTKILAEKYLEQDNQVHGYSDLEFNVNLSDPENGKFTFFSALCHGSSKNNCNYLNAYLISPDYGVTWTIGLLE